MARRVTFTEDGARRVAEATRAYERGSRNMPGIKFRTAEEAGGVRLGTIDASWSKGTTATVSELLGDGTEPPVAIQFEAVNYFADVTVEGSGGSGEVKVACALVGSTWILIAAECS
jgi:hypothetical protein